MVPGAFREKPQGMIFRIKKFLLMMMRKSHCHVPLILIDWTFFFKVKTPAEQRLISVSAAEERLEMERGYAFGFGHLNVQRSIFMHQKIGLLLLVLLLSLSGCGYNSIQKNDEAVIAAWGNVEAAYQRRADLIPNLVETVKAYAGHEKETLTAVVEARSKVSQVKLGADVINDPQAMAQFQSAQGGLSSALSRLMVVVEKYPDLKANQNFADLQHQLEGTENRINVARVRYNEAVRIFNSSIRTFPNNLTNNFLLNLPRREPFKAEAGAETAPAVQF